MLSKEHEKHSNKTEKTENGQQIGRLCEQGFSLKITETEKEREEEERGQKI